VLTAVAGPPAAGVALRAPKIALLADLQPVVGGRAGVENSAVHAPHAWMRFVMTQRLGLPVDVLGPAEIAAGRLDDGGYTAFVVADTPVPDGALTPAASARIRAFVAAGGTYAGVRRPGLAVARAVALTGAAERPVPALDVPGATFAVEIDDRDPVAWGTRGGAASPSTPMTRCSTPAARRRSSASRRAAGSSPATRAAPPPWAARPPCSIRPWARAASSSSPAIRASAPTSTARRACWATPCSRRPTERAPGSSRCR